MRNGHAFFNGKILFLLLFLLTGLLGNKSITLEESKHKDKLDYRANKWAMDQIRSNDCAQFSVQHKHQKYEIISKPMKVNQQSLLSHV